MGYPYQPPVPGYGAPYSTPPGYPTPPKPKMAKGPAIAAGVLGIVTAVMAVVNLVLYFAADFGSMSWRGWIDTGSLAIDALGLAAVGIACLSRRRVAGWLLFGVALLGVLRVPLIWIVYEMSPALFFQNFFRGLLGPAIWIFSDATIALTFGTAVVALVAALSREATQRSAMPMSGQQHASPGYPPSGYPPYGR